MSLEALLFAAVLATASGILLAGLVSPGRGRLATVLLLPVGAAALWLLTGYRPPAAGESAVTDRPVQLPEQGYVTSDACWSCHPGNHATWRASYHRTMTQPARREAIKADFTDVTLTLGEFTYRLSHSRRDGKYEVEIVPPPGGHVAFGDLERKVVMVTGSHHYQVYWLDTPNGREVEQFPFAWLIADARWVPRAAALLMPPMKFEGIRAGGWNRACIRCHTTHGRPKLGENRRVESEVSEFGIACEACHGPGAQHVARHRDPLERYKMRLSEERVDDTIVNPAKLSHDRSTEVCGQCHGILEMRNDDLFRDWIERGYQFRPGDELAATRYPVQYTRYLEASARLQGEDEHQGAAASFFEKRYWPDGMIRVVGREYNALLDTPCFTNGDMSCLSCHRMHSAADDSRSLKQWADDQLERGMDGPAACVGCHGEYADAARVAEHTHHAAESSGSDCMNCHMPYTTYGLLKASRSHTIDSPDVKVELESGRPNACNLCHLDQTLAWAAGWLEQWYGTEPPASEGSEPVPTLSEDQRQVAASLLWLLEGDAGQRALAAWSMGWKPAQEASGTWWIAPHLARGLDDPYDAVRYIAGRSMGTLPGFDRLEFDFVAEAALRQENMRSALGIWEQLSREPGTAPPDRPATVLLAADGRQVEAATVSRLLARRSNRVVWLTE